MTLIEIASALQPKRVSSTKGGEYHCACPACGGLDRFVIWPSKDRYWCRQCHTQGDSIQYCRDFLGMPFKEAKRAAGEFDDIFLKPEPVESPFTILPIASSKYLDNKDWRDKAEWFVGQYHRQLMSDEERLADLKQSRWITNDTIRTHRLGWNYDSSKWNVEGKDKPIFLPPGLVIPCYDRLGNANLAKIKIRRADWKKGDTFPKYHEVAGSKQFLPLYGHRMNCTAILLESELDAIKLVQEIGDLCSCVALGGAAKRADEEIFRWLSERKLILYSLDNDESGKAQYSYWRSRFPQLRDWLTPHDKSAADAAKKGMNLKEWWLEGINYWIGRL